MMRDLANLDCRWCGRCGRDLAADEPVWPVIYRRGRGRVVCCRDCARQAEERFDYARRCSQCSRVVYDQRWIWPCFCSERCRQSHAKAKRSVARAEQRAGCRCDQCEEVLSADRADARYCSNACRQRAYRARASNA
jgi:hypothetical protein